MKPIYTRQGDGGETRLATGGEVVRKDAQRLECLGALDEVSSCLGLARATLEGGATPPGTAELAAVLQRMQHEIGVMCAELAHPVAVPAARRIGAAHVSALERDIDAWSAELPALREFVLPGGGPIAAQLHVARAVCRRAEREVVRLAGSELVGEHAIPYLNRLSDSLFVAARHAARILGPGSSQS